MKNILLGATILFSTLSVFGADLDTLRTARSVLFSKTELTRVEADTLHNISIEILKQETQGLRKARLTANTNNPLTLRVKEAREAVYSFINNASEDRTGENVDELNQLIAERSAAENALIQSLRSEGF